MGILSASAQGKEFVIARVESALVLIIMVVWHAREPFAPTIVQDEVSVSLKKPSPVRPVRFTRCPGMLKSRLAANVILVIEDLIAPEKNALLVLTLWVAMEMRKVVIVQDVASVTTVRDYANVSMVTSEIVASTKQF